MDNPKNQIKLLKGVQVGNFQTGKTSLFVRYKEGFDFFIKEFEIDEQQVKFQFFDDHSCQRFQSIPTSYCKGCQAFMISYDITDRQSFENVLFYYKDYSLKRGNNVATLFLVGNKCDLEEEREISYKEGEQLSESLGMIFMEVSAKEDYQVKELFEKIMHYTFNIN